jgi:S1-C subfamily serine protease
MVTVQCICGFRMEADVARLGQNAKCARCGATFRLWPLDEDKQSSSSAAWYLRVGTTQFGPFTAGDLMSFVAEGRIQKDSLVRRGDQGPWTPAARVRGLLDAPPPKLPPAQVHVVPARRLRAAPVGSPRMHADRDRARSSTRPDVARTLASHPGILLALLIAVGTIGVLAFLVAGRGRHGEKEPMATAKAAPPKPPSKPPPKLEQKPAPVVALKPEPLTPQTLVARAGPSVAVIEGRSGSGSGFLVGPGLLVTNRHVVDDELIESIRVKWPDGGTDNRGLYGVQLVYEDPEADLALLSVETKLPALPIAADDAYTRGQEVLCIGSPGVGDGRVLSNAISRGLLGTAVTIEGHDLVQLDMAINPGNSGGPVFNMDGKVVGIVTLKATRLVGVGFCLPVAALRRTMDRAKKLSDAESERAVAGHRLRVCAGALLRFARTYAAAGRVYLRAMDASVLAKEDINKGLARAQSAAEDVLREIRADALFLVPEHSQRPVRDHRLDPKSRAAYSELLDVYTALRGHVDSPHGTLDTFRKAQDQCVEDLRRIEAHFVREGVRLPD